MLKELDTYDWKEVFGFAGEPDTDAGVCTSIDTPLGSTASDAPFTREDVVEILLLVEGENDGPEWIGVFHLKDGRYVYLHASCDYTGWDCRAGGSAVGCSSPSEVVTMGMTEDQRKHLRLDEATIIDPRFQELLGR